MCNIMHAYDMYTLYTRTHARTHTHYPSQGLNQKRFLSARKVLLEEVSLNLANSKLDITDITSSTGQ